MNKAFSLFLMVALVLGGSLGGAFVGGVALGKSQGPDSPETGGADRFLPEPGGDSSRELTRDRSGSPGQDSRADGSGQPESRQRELDQQGQPGSHDTFAGRPDERSDGRNFGGRGGFSGTVERVQGNIVMIGAAQGPVSVTVGPDTAIQRMVEGSLEDLKEGVQIRVQGLRGEDGDVQARSITLVPERAEDSLGRSGTRRER